MRLRWPLLLPLALAALGALALFARRGAEPAEPAVEPLALPEPDPEPPQAEAAPLEIAEEPDSARELAAGDAGARAGESALAALGSDVDAASPPVVLHGTLVDENTRLPLPEFELVFAVAGEGDGPHRQASARTDAQGRFECAEPILVARCAVVFLDRPAHRRGPVVQTLELEDVRKGELALGVAWGPTYRLAFAPKEAIAPLELDLRLRGAPVRGRNANASDWEGVHAGDPPWVRFAPIDRDAPKVEKLVARARNGLWAGEAEASTTRGIAPGVTLITFEERAVLDGSVQDADKQPIADVDVALEAQDSSGQTLKRGARTGADGHFRFEQLPSCTGQLRALSVRHAPWVQGVTLLAGQEQKLPVVLAPLENAGAIDLCVESESGRYTPEFTLVLSLENDPVAQAGGEGFVRHQRAQWTEEAGRKVARFRFADLPKQVFRIGLQKDDFFAWDPLQLSLQPPAENARILIRDGIPNASLAFRLADRETGEALPRFELTLEFPGSRMGPRTLGARSGRAFLEHLPLERKLSWRVDAAGHAPVLGDLSDFGIVERLAEGELRVCERELQPGWGEAWRFVDSRSRAPLKGVRVLLDGVEAGTSGPGGRVLVRAPARPERIEYRCDELGIKPRPLKPERRNGCVADVRVAPAQPQKKGKG